MPEDDEQLWHESQRNHNYLLCFVFILSDDSVSESAAFIKRNHPRTAHLPKQDLMSERMLEIAFRAIKYLHASIA